MNHSELENFFLKYLRRKPNDLDYKSHLHKNANDFQKEIENCKEYKNLQSNSNKFKIAFLLSGHIRKNPISSSILDLKNKYDFDIFIHTWDTLGIKGTEQNLDANKAMIEIQFAINNLPNVKKFKIDNNKKYIESIKNEGDNVKYFNYSSPEEFIKSQLYSINQSFNLLEAYQNEHKIKYDIIFKLRFDLKITQFTINQDLINDIRGNNIIFMPNNDNNHSHPDYGTSCWACNNIYYKHKYKIPHIFDHTNVVCDTFAYGSYESMKKYCSLYHNYDKLNKQFESENLKMLKMTNSQRTSIHNNKKDVLIKNHIDSLYFYRGSYPERLLQFFLKDYLLPESKIIKTIMTR